MGCDIHVVLERKFGDKWIGLREVRSFPSYVYNSGDKSWKQEYFFCRANSRNYDLFGKLANVRGEGPEPKGVPDDASELSKALIEQWDSDGHSHSYCTLQEYLEALAASEDNPAEVFLSGKHPAVEAPHMFYFGMYEPEDGEEYRVVFWFDN